MEDGRDKILSLIVNLINIFDIFPFQKIKIFPMFGSDY